MLLSAPISGVGNTLPPECDQVSSGSGQSSFNIGAERRELDKERSIGTARNTNLQDWPIATSKMKQTSWLCRSPALPLAAIRVYCLDPSGERDHVTHTFISGLGKKSSTSIIPYNLNMEPIEAALAFLGPWEPGKKYHYEAVAKRFDCSRPTLLKQHRGVQGPRRAQYEKL
jgi:hypothetical protein